MWHTPNPSVPRRLIVNTARITLRRKLLLNHGVKGFGVGRLSRLRSGEGDETFINISRDSGVGPVR